MALERKKLTVCKKTKNLQTEIPELPALPLSLHPEEHEEGCCGAKSKR